MGLVAYNVDIIPNSSHILDGHNPDGGTAAIPLTWSTVPAIGPISAGVPFSIDLFANYLTQAGGAIASLSPGQGFITGSGWSLTSAGVLQYSGTGQGLGTIQVRATIGAAVSDSNAFSYQSIGAPDSLAPNVPTNPSMVSRTTNQIVVTCDPPADVPWVDLADNIPATGLKEVLWYVNGVFNGSTAYAAGLSLELQVRDIALSVGTRRLMLGHYTALLPGQMSTGIPNKTVVNDTGPITAGTDGLSLRYQWQNMETAQGVYNYTQWRRDITACSSAGTLHGGHLAINGGIGPMFMPMIIQKTFGGLVTVHAAAALASQVACNLTDVDGFGNASTPVGKYGALFTQGTYGVGTLVLRLPVTVSWQSGDGANHNFGSRVTWTGALPSGGATLSLTIDILNTNTSPVPDYLLQASIPYHGGIGNGWVCKRWDPVLYLPRFKALVEAFAAADPQDPNYPSVKHFNDHPNFAGIATQETANNGAEVDPGYTQANYRDGMISEGTYIGNACSKARHYWFMNFMSGNTGSATTNLQQVAGALAQFGMVLLGPDLVTKGNIVNPRCYPVYKLYSDGNATVGQGGVRGYTMCSIQTAEWDGGVPADTWHKVQDLFDYSHITTANTPATDTRGTAWDVPSHLNIDGLLTNWYAGTNGIGQSFANAAGPMMRNNRPPFGALPTPSGTGLSPGSVVQTGMDYSVLSNGTGINTGDDQWTCADGSVTGDFTIICKFDGMTGGDLTSSPVMGIRISNLDAAIATGVYLVATLSQLRFRSRTTDGGAVNNLQDTASQGWNVSKYVKINCSGSNWSVFYSLDSGLNWTACGTTSLALPSVRYIHLFAGTTGASSVTALFRQVNVQQLNKINYTIPSLASGVTYNIQAKSRDIANNDSALSPVLQVTTL